MIVVTVKADLREVTKAFKDLKRKQVPFATALTLTKLAQGGQRMARGRLSQTFELRAKARVEAGIRIKTANKRDFGRDIHSRVFVVDDFMSLHAFGGKKKPLKTDNIAIPGDDLLDEGARTSTGRIKRSKRPKALYARIKAKPRKRKKGRNLKPRPFIFTNSKGLPSIAIREGDSRRATKVKLYRSFHKSFI